MSYRKEVQGSGEREVAVRFFEQHRGCFYSSVKANEMWYPASAAWRLLPAVFLQKEKHWSDVCGDYAKTKAAARCIGLITLTGSLGSLDASFVGVTSPPVNHKSYLAHDFYLL